jgi:hypothetical protein
MALCAYKKEIPLVYAFHQKSYKPEFRAKFFSNLLKVKTQFCKMR